MTDAILASLVVFSAVLSLLIPIVICYLNRSQTGSEAVVEGVTEVLNRSPYSSDLWLDDLSDEELLALYKLVLILDDWEKDLSKPYYLEEISVRRV